MQMPFKKGQATYNAHPIGYIRDNGNGYLEEKIGINKWKKVHVILWEKANGTVPKNHKVIFIDKNKRNFNLNNLQCLSYRDVLDMNSITRYPADLRFAMKKLKKLKNQIKNGKKQN